MVYEKLNNKGLHLRYKEHEGNYSISTVEYGIINNGTFHKDMHELVDQCMISHIITMTNPITGERYQKSVHIPMGWSVANKKIK